jgi:hypothetical protein
MSSRYDVESETKGFSKTGVIECDDVRTSPAFAARRFGDDGLEYFLER